MISQKKVFTESLLIIALREKSFRSLGSSLLDFYQAVSLVSVPPLFWLFSFRCSSLFLSFGLCLPFFFVGFASLFLLLLFLGWFRAYSRFLAFLLFFATKNGIFCLWLELWSPTNGGLKLLRRWWHDTDKAHVNVNFVPAVMKIWRWRPRLTSTSDMVSEIALQSQNESSSQPNLRILESIILVILGVS